MKPSDTLILPWTVVGRDPRQFSTQLETMSVWFAFQRKSRATEPATVLREFIADAKNFPSHAAPLCSNS